MFEFVEILTLTPLAAGLMLLFLHEIVPNKTKEKATDLIRYANLGIAIILFLLATQIGFETIGLTHGLQVISVVRMHMSSKIHLYL